MWILTIQAWYRAISPVFIVACFLPVLPKFYRWGFGVLLFVMLVGDFGARTQVMWSLATIMVLFAFWLWHIGFKHIVSRAIRMAQIALLIAPVVLLVLGISGVFNVLEANSEQNGGKLTQTSKKMSGDTYVDDAAADTRTFIYVDVINSAINNHYIMFGRTLARGNDCTARFGDDTFELTRRYERFANEIGMTNIFTWLGIVGLLLYVFIYFYASFMGMRRSSNIYVKMISLLVAFNFLWGWIENVTLFKIQYITIWMQIAICLSPEFRRMTDSEFEGWLRSLFVWNKRKRRNMTVATPYKNIQ